MESRKYAIDLIPVKSYKESFVFLLTLTIPQTQTVKEKPYNITN